jgi:hypothetical protein
MPIIRSITPEINLAISNLVATGSGSMPLDATLGGAIKDFVTKHSLMDTYIHGGPIMHPLLLVSILVFGTVIERFFFIMREKKGTATPYKLGKTDQGYNTCSFTISDESGFADRRYVLLHSPKGPVLALSVKIPSKTEEKVLQAAFARMVKTARFASN